MADAGGRRAPLRFVLLYALAWAGGAIAYTPLLTILLPGQVARLAGPAAGIGWLAQIALVGAIAASLANILFGYLSDLAGNRRAWVAAGLVLSSAALPQIGAAATLAELTRAVAVWQIALNLMLAPLAAWAGDQVPDDSKGLLGGMLAVAPGAGALAGALVTHPALDPGPQRLLVVAILVAACVLPLLLFAPRAPAPPPAPAHAAPLDPAARRRMVQMWLARLAVQIAEATLFAFLLFWLRRLDPALGETQTARLFFLIMVLAIPLALAVGRWSDRHDRPLAPLAVAALFSALGLAGMAGAGSVGAAMAAYGLFGLASAVFLALHSAQTLRVLPRPARRGRDLGLFNLTNTLPALIMPGLAFALVPEFGFAALFALLGVLALAAAALLAALARSGARPA